MTLAFAALDVSAPSNEKSVVYLAAKEGGEANPRMCFSPGAARGKRRSDAGGQLKQMHWASGGKGIRTHTHTHTQTAHTYALAGAAA